jgi:uncharacterized protein YukJ
MAENIENAQNISLIQLSNTQTVLKVVTKTVRNQGSGEICLMLDMDLSETADKKIEQLTFTLNHLNAGSFRMMRWCIKDRLHKALQPKIVA